jgi:hypothetical protein
MLRTPSHYAVRLASGRTPSRRPTNSGNRCSRPVDRGVPAHSLGGPTGGEPGPQPDCIREIPYRRAVRVIGPRLGFEPDPTPSP